MSDERLFEKLTEAEFAELLDLMNQCSGIGISAPCVTLTFPDYSIAGRFFDRLHKALRKGRWHDDG